jgi:hypothetical protein
MIDADKDYRSAMGLLDQNAKTLKSAHSDPVAWNLNTALALLVRGIQQDMAEIKLRFDALDKRLSKLK